MRIQPTKRTASEGNILLITLVTCVVIGFSLASYLTLVSHQNYMTMRSLAWSSALPVVEAGIEEALTHLHHAGLTNLATEGWYSVNSEWGNTYYKRRVMGDEYYETHIFPSDPPVIYSRGYVPAPYAPLRQTAMILASIVSEETTSKRNYIRRGVRVTTERDPLFTAAMVAKGIIDLDGNNVKTDSFDSRTDAYSTGGMYDPAKSKDNGDVATNSELIDSLNVGDADIKGKIATGPGGSITIGADGTVGDAAWVDGGHLGIQAGHSSDDMNMEIPDVEVPWTDSKATGGTIDGVNYDLVLASSGGMKRYEVSSLSGSVYVAPGSTVLLYISGSVKLAAKEQVYISPGATLIMVVGGATGSLGGQGVVNPSGNALAFQYYGLPSNTSVSFGGNAAFSGVVYAPEAHFHLGGGGNDTYDFVGASVTKSILMNGHYNFHYDEALADLGPIRGYVVNDWIEI